MLVTAGDQLKTARTGTMSYNESASHATKEIAPISHTTTLQPIDVCISPLIAQCLQKGMLPVQELAKGLEVEVVLNVKEQKIQVRPTKQALQGWQVNAPKMIESHISSSYAEKDLKIPQEAATEIAVSLSTLGNEVCIAFAFKDQHTSLTVAGTQEAMNILETKLTEIMDRYAQTEECIPLHPQEYVFLSCLKNEMLTRNHDVHVHFDPSASAVVLRGSVRNVSEIKQAIPEYCYHASVPVSLQPAVIEYFLTRKGKQQLSGFLQQQSCRSAAHIETSSQNTLCLLCDQTDLDGVGTIAQSLQQEAVVDTLPLPRSFVVQLSELEDYDSYCRELETTQQVQITTFSQDSEVSIAGFAACVSIASQILTSYVREMSSMIKTVSINKGICRLFNGSMYAKLSIIIKRCEDNAIKGSFPDGKCLDPVIHLDGERMEVEQIFEMICQLVKSVARGCIPISRPGTCKYFREETTRMAIAGIEAERKVCIEITEVTPNATDDCHDDSAGYPSRTGFTKVCVAHTKEMKKIVLYVGDITEFTQSEVIVNAANGELNHVGGVAKAISDKGGQVIQEESYSRIRKHGKLDDGDVWLTRKVGGLPCKALIHAVGPQWQGGQRKEVALLQRACSQSLMQAKEYKSIAVPAIGSGVYGFPIDHCAGALIGAAIDFSVKHPMAELQEINFVLFKHDDTPAFITAIQKYLPSENILLSSAQDPYQKGASLPQISQARLPIHRQPTTSPETSRSKGRGRKSASLGASPDPIRLHRGSILDVKVLLGIKLIIIP